MYKPEIDSILADFDLSLSNFKEQSIISRINNNDLNVEIDDYFREVYEKSYEISEATNGMFDITVGPLINAYGFYSTNKQNISQATKDSLLEFVGYKKIKIEGNKLIKERPEIVMDCNAIAQGYAVDIVADFLESKGCKNYMIEIGGEIKVRGFNEFGENWRIGIDKPIEPSKATSREIQVILTINNKAIATSGNYRKFFKEEGIKYSHSVNPKTGEAIKHNLLSATIIANDCMTADGYATACMVVGVDKAKKIIENNSDLEAYFIFSDEKGEYQVYFTEGFNKYIKEE